MKKLVYWKCDGCNETLQGIVNVDGDFIADSEFDKPKNYRSVGCYLCGSFCGELMGEVEED